MPLLSAEQLKRIREIIDRYHAGFAIAVFGKEVDPALEESLKRAGLIPADAPRLIDDAYVYAQLLARSGDFDLANATPETIVNRIAMNPAPPHTAVEKATIQTAKTHAGEYCRGLASRVATNVSAKLTGREASLTPDAIRDIIKDKTSENRSRRELASTLKSDLGHEVGNWTRDWLRIATSESNDAAQEGFAATYEELHGDPLVSKLVRPDCCKDCRRLYVGADGEPIVFRLSELRANGSNVGRPRKAWKAVVGNTHPWCHCQLVYVPAGLAWSGGVLLPKGSIQKSFRPMASDKGIHGARHDALAGAHIGESQSNNDPSAAHQILILARVDLGLNGIEPMASAVDFDRDFLHGIGKVYVPTKYREIALKDEPVLLEPLKEEIFKATFGQGSVASLRFGDVDVPSIRALGHGPHLVALPLEACFHRDGLYSDARRNFRGAQPALVQLDQPRGGDWQLAHVSILAKSRRLHDRIVFQGIPISVENAEGTLRKWGDPNSGDHGDTWMQAAYGYIRETEGADGEHIDCYVGDDENASHVHVVHQVKKLGPDRFEGHDEDKVMLGYSTAEDAKAVYCSHYNDPRFFGSMTSIPVERFRKILAANKGKRLRKIVHPKLDLEPLSKAHGLGWTNLDGIVDMTLKPPVTRAVPINLMQGADNVPHSSRAPGKTQIADEMGLTAKGRKKKRRDAKKRQEARRESRKRHDPGWTAAPLGLLPKDKPGAYQRAEDYKPPMLDQLRAEARHAGLEVGAHKREVAEAIVRKRLTNSRVSDITKQLAALKKSGPRLVIALPRKVNVFARALVKSQGPFIGPKGGKWANPEHTIPWKGDQLPAGHEPKEGDEHEIHARGLHPFTVHVASVDGDNVRIAQQKGGAYGATMPKASVKHFVNDLRGVVEGPESKDPRVNAVVQGKAEFLGKGDDGVAFKVGDHVVKASTTVPYQPFNQGHLTPEAAAARLEEQVKTSNAMADDGVPGIMRSEIVHNGDKAFQIKPYVDIPEKLTRAQLDSVAESVLAAHKHGWVFGDEIQVGVHDGKLVHFDTGKAHRSQENGPGRPAHFGTDKDDDINALKRLYKAHGETYLTDAEKADPHTEWEKLSWETKPEGMTNEERKTHRAKLFRHWPKVRSFLKNHPEHESFLRAANGEADPAEFKTAMDRFKDDPK